MFLPLIKELESLKKEIKDFLSGLVFIIVSLILLVVIIPRYVPLANADVGLQPDAVVKIASYVILICGTYLAFSPVIKNPSIIKESVKAVSKAFESRECDVALFRVCLALLLFFGYYIAFDILGFFFSSFIVIFLLALLFQYDKYVILSLVDLISVLLLHWVFTTYFNITFPGWSPFDLF